MLLIINDTSFDEEVAVVQAELAVVPVVQPHRLPRRALVSGSVSAPLHNVKQACEWQRFCTTPAG